MFFRRKKTARDEKVRIAKSQGKSTRDIAAEFGISVSRVYQIVTMEYKTKKHRDRIEKRTDAWLSE